MWTRQDNGIEYNADRGTPAAGFRLGFPVVQRRYINGQTGQYAFLLLTPAGGRVELSATGTANVYEARDGSYAQLVEEDYYNIIARHSGKCLDVAGASQDNGGNVQQWDCLNNAQQQWQLVSTDNGYYQIVARHSGKALDVAGVATEDGANVHQWQYVGGLNQQWRFGATESGYNQVVARHSGKTLDVAGVSPDNGANVQQWTWVGGWNQQWLLARRLTLRTSDGTQYSFVQTGDGNFHCIEVKDRNGNCLTINYNANGQLNYVTDTLGRVVNFEYAGDHNLAAIKQTWNGATHTWATFSYGSVLVQPNFPGLAIYGANNEYVTVLTAVGLGDGSYYQFNYETNWGIANRIRRYGPGGRQLNYTFYNIPPTSTAQSDSPRFTEQHVWAVDWNDGAEAVTYYNVDANGEWSQQALPDGTIYSELYATSGWATGLPIRTEVWSGGQMKKWTTTEWTQDNTGLSYQQNPRPVETNIYDAEGNRRRTTISYTSYSLPMEVTEYAADAVTPLRRTHTDYIGDNTAYLNAHIIGLAWQRLTYDGNGSLVVKNRYMYDENWGGYFLQATPQTPTQHDEANYNSGFVMGRGNLVWVGRFDVNDPDNWDKVTATSIGYNETGQPIFINDPVAGRQTRVDYTDSFAAGGSRNTFAYPTTVTDADNFSSTSQYNYDMGAVTATQTPPPAGFSQGPTINYSYDPVGRPQQVQNLTSGAYTRYEYDVDWGHTRAYSSIESGQGESYQNTIVDGAGHVYLLVPSHAGSAGGYRVARMEYDALGRLRAQSQMTETDSGGTPAGDDAASGYVWTYQSYDWQGRPTVTINPDGTQREVSYGGCGCAGGAVTTVRDERGRGKRYTQDALGRLWRVEELHWDTSVYATTYYNYYADDQLESSSQTGQWRGWRYDGYGRLNAEYAPERGTWNTYEYNADDTLRWARDGRGATAHYTYNGRQLVTNITYDVPAGVAATAPVSYSYDAAGNRTQMASFYLGTVNYEYNQLSQLTAETYRYDALPGQSYRLAYSYNLGGELTSVTNPWGAAVGYAHDKDGRTTNVTGANYAGVTSYASNLQYRAFDGLKRMTYGNGRTLSVGYNNRQQPVSWQVPQVLGWNYSYTDYYGADDGRVMFAQNTASSTAGGGRDAALDRSYDYDQVGRLTVAHTGYEARLQMGRQGANDATDYGAYSQTYGYDVWGNMTTRVGWGGYNGNYLNWTETYTNNRHDWMQYDAAGHMVNDGGQYTYDAAGRQTNATYPPSWQGYTLQQAYDGDGQRVQKVDNGTTWYYLRSSVLGGQVVCDLNSWGGWHRGYVYLGGQLLAIQSAGSVQWVAQDPVTKSQRLTDVQGNIISGIDLDPWGGETNRSWSSAWQPHKYTSYERDGNSNDQAGARTYHGFWMRFDQPDPYAGSYSLTEPQSFNRYSYTQNDPVNHVDPSGLWSMLGCSAQFGSCGGGWDSGGQGYSGHPFDSSTYEYGGGGPTSENIAIGLARYESWLAQQRQNTGQQFLNDGLDELKKRLHERPDCANLFGGEKKALKTLSKTKFSFGSLDRGGIAETNGRNVTLDSSRFTESGATLAIAENIRVSTVGGHPSTTYTQKSITPTGVTFAAFALFHELGHRSKIYGEYDNDGSSMYSNLEAGANNEKIRAACFSEIKPQ